MYWILWNQRHLEENVDDFDHSLRFRINEERVNYFQLLSSVEFESLRWTSWWTFWFLTEKSGLVINVEWMMIFTCWLLRSLKSWYQLWMINMRLPEQQKKASLSSSLVLHYWRTLSNLKAEREFSSSYMEKFHIRRNANPKSSSYNQSWSISLSSCQSAR